MVRLDLFGALVWFFNDRNAALLLRDGSMGQTFGQIGIATRAELLPLSFSFQCDGSFHYIEKTLRGGMAQFALRFELRGVFSESCADRGTNMNDRGSTPHAGERGANKGVRSEEQVIALMRAASSTEIMHGTSFPEIALRMQVASASDIRNRGLFRRPRAEPIPPDHD